MTAPFTDIPAGVPPEQAALFTSQAAFAQQQERLRNQVMAAVAAMWATSAVTSAFGPIDAARFAARLIPVAVGAERAMAAMTMAQLNRVTQPRKPVLIPLEVVSGSALRGKDPADYYQRPYREVLWKLSEGKSLDQAVKAGRRRAEQLVQTDVQLAHTHTAQRFLAALDEQNEAEAEAIRTGALAPRGTLLDTPREPTTTPREPIERPTRTGQVVGYRRVLSNRPNHCALCVLASTQRYRKEDLMPIHPGCGCTVIPVFETDWRSDQRVLDPSLAQEIHNIIRRDLGQKYVDAAARDGAAKYHDIVVVREHGELGPVMGVRGQHFERDPNRPGHLGNRRVNPREDPDDVTPQDLDKLF